MSFLDKAKELSSRVADKTVEFGSDEVIVSTIIKAVEKREKVNAILKACGSNYYDLIFLNRHPGQTGLQVVE